MIGKTERHVHKGSHCDSKQQWRSCATITLLLLVHARYTWVLFFVHIPFVVNCTFNATPTERLQQISLLFTTNRTDCMFFLWKLHLARPSHPGHSTILLWSQSPCGKCAKLHSVAASNNRYHTPRSLYYCLSVPHIYRCYSSCTSHSWWIAHSTQCQRRNCNNTNCQILLWI